MHLESGEVAKTYREPFWEAEGTAKPVSCRALVWEVEGNAEAVSCSEHIGKWTVMPSMSNSVFHQEVLDDTRCMGQNIVM